APSFIEEVDGECLERNEPADEPRNLVQEIVGIEHRGDLATKVEQGRKELLLGRGRVIFRGVVRRGFIRWKCLAHFDVSSFHWEAYRLYCAREPRPPSSRRRRHIEIMDLSLPLDYSAIERILPHRYPFLLVDRIIELDPDKR